ncbi:DNA-directed RNA polymerase [Pseudomonas weihenstephanensis]|uniref:DNA-directed RNA polymerase n=1 Tax=Pseudomonas weihenstephanensis TaxID=1608994 RepID=UPI00193B2E50|nr:DNA-directed RNA polymerase [Pseudomonas weihenstephanensis]MBM1189374.1 DNA-dependent RNA polymerase [Pseudomonas weihenstephanensis]
MSVKSNIKVTKHDFSDIQSESSWAFETLAGMYGDELAAAQLSLEHEAYTLGEERFNKQLERQIERGEFADNATAKPVLAHLVPKLVEAYEAWIDHQVNKVRRKHVGLSYFLQMSPEAVAAVTIKIVLGDLAKPMVKTIQQVAVRIGQCLEEEARFGRIRTQEAAHFNKHVKKALDTRNAYTYKVKFMEKVEGHMLDAEQLTSAWVKWDTLDNDVTYHMGIRLLELLIESTQLVEVKREFAGIKAKDGEYVYLHPEWANKLCDRAFSLAGVSPQHQPMIVPPREWTQMVGGGYWAKGRKPMPLIRVRSKKALNRYRDVYMPEVYKAVNLAQQTAWSINTKVLDVANAVMTWKHVPIDGFPLAEREELPTKPEGMEEDAELLKTWKREAATVYRRDKARVSRRLGYEFALEQATKFSAFESIYFPYNLDWRGRVYAIPVFNPQGNDMTKGLLQASIAEPVGEEGIEWLMIHGANCAGVDKVAFDQRKQWVKDNEELILGCAADPLNNTEWTSMDSPFCFLAFCFEWEGVKQNGAQHLSALPIAFDGSCSGIQHFSAMLRDERGGRAVNLVPSETVQDIYKLVADRVNEALARDLAEGSDDSTETVANKKTGEIAEKRILGTRGMAAGWLGYGVTRSVTKRSVMTLAYGSKAFGFSEQLISDIINPAMDRGVGQEFFANVQQCARYMANLIWEAVGVTVVKAVEAMKWLQVAAKHLAKEVVCKESGEQLKPCMPVFWVTPDGFPVWQEYMKPEQRRIDLTFLGSMRLQTTINVRDSNVIDGLKQQSGISPNFVHSQDGSHLRKTVVKASEAYGVTFFSLIHDSFGTIPAKAGAMFRAVRETMVETYDATNVLADFRDQFLEQLHETQLSDMPEVPAQGSLDITQILESDFAFA